MSETYSILTMDTQTENKCFVGERIVCLNAGEIPSAGKGTKDQFKVPMNTAA